MKNVIKSILFFVATFLVFDFIFYKARPHFGGWRFFNFFEMLGYFSIIFLFILGILYNKLFTFKSSSVKIVLVLVLAFIVSYHLTGRVITINQDYFFVKTSPWDASRGLWKYDKHLGYKGQPNATGVYTYYIGDSITHPVPVFFDAHGFRTVPDSLQIASDKKDLFLGCSWTFGDLVHAENTYPYLVEKALGHSYFNTGGSGYGFAQMYQIADSLIPRNHFTYTFIQLSPWLADRAVDIAAPSSYGYWPFPYFSRNKDGKYELNYPSFGVSARYEHNWRSTKVSYADKLHFWARLGIETEIFDYYSYKFAKLKGALGIQPKPVKEKAPLEIFFYKYMIDLCRANNSTPVIVKFGYKYPVDERTTDVMKWLNGTGVRVIDLDSATHELAKGSNDLQYSKLFHIWHVTKGGDSIFANGHPGVYAHKVFADKIISVLKNQ